MKRLKTDEEIKNHEFKFLTPREVFYKGNKRYWKCECECGNMVDRGEYAIIMGLAESCGCKHPRNLKGKETSRYKGYEELNGQYISSVRCKAESRNIEWSETSMTPKYLWDLFEKQQRKCRLSGLELDFKSGRNRSSGNYQTASLDRIDSSKGYIIGNVQWVHKDVNKMKQNLSENRFLELCKLIVLESLSQKSHEL